MFTLLLCVYIRVGTLHTCTVMYDVCHVEKIFLNYALQYTCMHIYIYDTLRTCAHTHMYYIHVILLFKIYDLTCRKRRIQSSDKMSASPRGFALIAFAWKSFFRTVSRFRSELSTIVSQNASNIIVNSCT